MNTFTDSLAGRHVTVISSSAGTLELAVREGSARDALAIGRGAPVLVMGL